MKILVIGGSGFLGSHVVDQLVKNNYEVINYDLRKSTYAPSSVKQVIGDLNDVNLLNKSIRGVDIVYHFAALSDLNDSVNKPSETVQTNIMGTVNILEQSKINKVKRFIYASTVYVNSKEGSFYKCSKQAAELYIKEYFREYGLEYTILRYGSLYGPRSDERNGLYNIVKRAINEKILLYEGNKDAMREFIHVEDAAKSSVEILDKNYVNNNVILTGLESFKVADLLKLIGEMIDLNKEVEFVENDREKHYIRTPYSYEENIGRKYIPENHIDLGQGLLQLVDYIKNQ